MTQTTTKTMEQYRTNKTLRRHSWARPPTIHSKANAYNMLNGLMKKVKYIILPAWTDNSS